MTAKDDLKQALSDEQVKAINATKMDMQRLEGFARAILKRKDIKVTQRIHHMRRCVGQLGKTGLFIKDEQLKEILYQERAVLNGSNKPWRGGEKMKFNPAPFMWHGIVMANTTNLIVSLPKVGKSRLFTQMYGQLAKGEDSFLGQKLQDEIPPIYIAGTDQPDDDWALCLRLAGLLDKKTDTLDKRILRLHTKNKNPIHLDDKGIDTIAAACQEFPKLLLLLDSYSSCVAPLGLNESDANFAEPLLDLQEAISPYKPTVIIIHHSGKGNAGLGASMSSRGTTALPAAVSQTVNLSKMQKESPLAPTDDRVKLITEGRASKPLDLLIEQIDNGEEWILHGDADHVAKVEAVQDLVDGLNARQTLAIEDITDHWNATGQPMNAQDLADAIGIEGKNPHSRAREVLASLEKIHLVIGAGDKKAKGNGGGKPMKLYKPTKEAISLYGTKTSISSNASNGL
tara:strand:+ start:452 stop:1819 length:1368 start_codon:yes stop_codon:yes gene_type:complete